MIPGHDIQPRQRTARATAPHEAAATTVPLIASALTLAIVLAFATPGTAVARRLPPPPIEVVAVGDISLGSAPGRLIASKGPKAPFTDFAPMLRSADVAVGNLECPISSRGSAVPGKTYTFRGDPKAVRGLAWAGFDLLALGNNHARDYGGDALLDTMRHLRKAGISYTGAGKNRGEAFAAASIDRAGSRIAFLSFSQIGPADFAATDTRSGTAFVYRMDRRNVRAAIEKAALRSDYVIVSYHWGIEKEYAPTASQVADGRFAIDAGADLVLSHHPHRIQGVEYYKKGLIAYSLGNFVFSPGSSGGRDTLALTVRLGPKGVLSAHAVPAHIEATGRPVRPKGPTAKRILQIIERTSEGRGTRVNVRGETRATLKR